MSFLKRFYLSIPVIEPDNKYLLTWEFIVFIATIIIFFLMPIELFFSMYLINDPSGDLLRIICVLGIYVLDLLLRFNIGFY
jgi:hypothetical protein